MNGTILGKPDKGEGPRLLPLAFGFFCAWAQLTLLSDLMNLLGGQALWLGWFLGVWLMFGGIGPLLGGRIPEKYKRTLLRPTVVIVALLFPLASLFLQWLPGKLTMQIGLPVPVLASLGFGALAAGVMSLLLGFLFISIQANLNPVRGRSRTAFLYVVETIGFAIGAILFIAMSGWGGHILKAIIAGAVLGIAYILDCFNREEGKGFGKAIASRVFMFVFIIIILLRILPIEGLLVSDRYAPLGEAYCSDTPYGRLIRVDAEWNHSFYLDGGLILTTDDHEYAEDLGHIVLLQHPGPREILILELGSDRLPFEALKYSGAHITLVEPNKILLRQWTQIRNTEIDENRLTLICNDPREFLESHKGKFDAILIPRAEPSDLLSNRMLTLEGAQALRASLREAGVIGIGLGAEENYANETSIIAGATAYDSLKTQFDNVLVTPFFAIFIAGDASGMTIDPIELGERMEDRGITGMFLNRYTLLDRLPPERTEGVRRSLEATTVGGNTDNNPVAFRYAFQLELQEEAPKLAKIYMAMSESSGVVLILILLISAGTGLTINLFRKRLNLAFIAASSGALLIGGEILLILLWQNIGGGLITHIAIITTAAMLGVATGAWGANRRQFAAGEATVSFVERILVLEMVMLIIAMVLLPSMGEWISLFILFVFALLIPATVGFQFALMCRIAVTDGRSDAALYGWDLLGASVGAIAMSFLFLPLAPYALIALMLAAPKFFSSVKR